MSLFIKIFLCFEITCIDLLGRSNFFFDGIKFPKSLYNDLRIYLFLVLKIIFIFLQVNAKKSQAFQNKDIASSCFYFHFSICSFPT